MAVLGIPSSSRRPAVERQKQDPFDRDLGRVLKGLQAASAGLQVMDLVDGQGIHALKKENELKRKDNLLKTEDNLKKQGTKLGIEIADMPTKILERTKAHETEISRKKFMTEQDLRKLYQKDPTKLANEARMTFVNMTKRIYSDFKRDPNSVSAFDQSVMVESFKKSVDATSAVLGGEFDTVRNETVGYLDKILLDLKKIGEGVILSDTQMTELASAMARIDQDTVLIENRLKEFYTGAARSAGMVDDQGNVQIDLIIPNSNAKAPFEGTEPQAVNNKQVEELMKTEGWSRAKARTVWLDTFNEFTKNNQQTPAATPEPTPTPNQSLQPNTGSLLPAGGSNFPR